MKRSPAYTIDADVEIRAPLGDPHMPEVLTPEDLAPFIESITISNSLSGAAGTFCVQLAPMRFRGSTTLANVIKPRSLVLIAVHRMGDPRDPAVTEDPEPLCCGVVTSVNVVEQYGQREPSRMVEIRGRMLSHLLVEHKWWFHHWLAAEGLVKAEPADGRNYMTPVQSDKALRDEQGLRALGFLAIDERLFDPAERHPVALMDAAFHFFVRSTPPAEPLPFIKLLFSDGRPLSDRLRFDVKAARAAHFDQAARLVQKFLPTSMPEASCWDLLRYFAETDFTEIFTDVRGRSLADCHVEVIARKPPWRGSIVDARKVALDPPGDGGSLFDDAWGDPEATWSWDKAVETVYLDAEDILGVPTVTRGDDTEAFSLYQVTPNIFVNSGAGTGTITWEQFIPPVIDEDETSPSFINRLGLRPWRRDSRTIPVLDFIDSERRSDGDIGEHCVAYATLAREWYHRLPALWRGSYVTLGRTSLRVGKRIVDKSIWREFYVTGVTHQIDLGGNRPPNYTTTAQVSRGRDLREGSE